jgi:3-oxoacyl-[acyl-carrier protein] reductase
MMTGMDLGITGRRAAVTGASRGIGLATARRLAAEGARVLLCGRDAEALAAAAAAVREAAGPGAEAAVLAVDITDPDAGERVLAAGAEAFGGLDVLVNNAGTTHFVPLLELSDADWEEQFALNVLGPHRLMRALVPAMAARGWGRVVNVSSSSGKRPSARNPAYSVGKAAELSLSRVWADGYAAQGVLINAVTPGIIATGLWTADGALGDQAAAQAGTTREQALADAAARIPLGRLGTDEDVAGVIAVLCSEIAANVAGAAWSVDGGSFASII